MTSRRCREWRFTETQIHGICILPYCGGELIIGSVAIRTRSSGQYDSFPVGATFSDDMPFFHWEHDACGCCHFFVVQLRIDRFTTSTEFRFTFLGKKHSPKKILFSLSLQLHSVLLQMFSKKFHRNQKLIVEKNHLQTLNQTLLKTYTNSNLFQTNVCKGSSI